MGKWSLERDDGRDNPEVALRSVVVKMVIVTAWVEAYRGMRLTKLRSQSWVRVLKTRVYKPKVLVKSYFFSNYETFRSKGTKSTHCNLLSFRSIYLSILVESREEFQTRGWEYDAGTMHWLIWQWIECWHDIFEALHLNPDESCILFFTSFYKLLWQSESNINRIFNDH